MSGELANKLEHRAQIFLEEADRMMKKGEHALACFFAEQAAQLYAKAVVYRILGEIPRTHRIRELLGLLVEKLKREGYEREASWIEEFSGENRRALLTLEEAYIDARYSGREFGKEEAREAVEAVKKLVELLKRVVESVWMG